MSNKASHPYNNPPYYLIAHLDTSDMMEFMKHDGFFPDSLKNINFQYRPVGNDEIVISTDQWIDGTRLDWVPATYFHSRTPNEINNSSSVKINRVYRRKISE